MPALLTSTSMRPNCALTAPTASTTDCSLVTSQSKAAAAVPSSTLCCAASTALSSTTTVAPFAAYASTIAEPIPEAPPVTTAILPSKEKSIIGPLSQLRPPAAESRLLRSHYTDVPHVQAASISSRSSRTRGGDPQVVGGPWHLQFASRAQPRRFSLELRGRPGYGEQDARRAYRMGPYAQGCFSALQGASRF